MDRWKSLIYIAITFLGISHTCFAMRNQNITLIGQEPDIVGVWDKTTYPATDFRNDTVIGYFDIWPENLTNVKFNYYCEDEKSKYLLENFTYGLHQGRLDPRPYFDLGTVDLYQPYYKHWRFWRVDTTVLSYPIHCEYTDIHRLFTHRFWKVTLVKGSKLGAIAFGFLQGGVAIIVSFIWGPIIIHKCQNERSLKPSTYFKKWFWTLQWGDFFSDLIHLGLLCMIGYCMTEAIGHSDLTRWRPTLFYNTAVIYTYLTLFSIVSSALRQLAYCRLDPLNVDQEELLKTHNIWKSLKDISDDWRWQRVFGQLGVLVLMGTYLSFVDTDDGAAMDNMASIVLAAVVVACIWSGGVTAVVGFRSTIHICAAGAKFNYSKARQNDTELPVRISYVGIVDHLKIENL